MIKEYEDKAAELLLDVQAEGKALASAREQLANLKRGAWRLKRVGKAKQQTPRALPLCATSLAICFASGPCPHAL